jgi:hypothetical protein
LVCPGTRIDTITATILGRVAAAIVLLGVRLGVVFLVMVRDGVASGRKMIEVGLYLIGSEGQAQSLSLLYAIKQTKKWVAGDRRFKPTPVLNPGIVPGEVALIRTPGF